MVLDVVIAVAELGWVLQGEGCLAKDSLGKARCPSMHARLKKTHFGSSKFEYMISCASSLSPLTEEKLYGQIDQQTEFERRRDGVTLGLELYKSRVRISKGLFSTFSVEKVSKLTLLTQFRVKIDIFDIFRLNELRED